MVIEDLTLTLVVGAAAIDSVNPCAIGVLLFLGSILLRVSPNKTTLLHLGITYILTVYIVYMLSGLGLIWFQVTLIRYGLAEIAGVAVGALVIALGLIELKDFFWYRKGISLEISPKHKKKITRMVEKISWLGVITIGGFVAMVELPCTGGPYLAITAILAKSIDMKAFLYLMVYNFIFIVPLLILLLLLYFGTSTLKLKQWRQKNRKWMNLSSGLLMIFLGTLLIVYYRYG